MLTRRGFLAAAAIFISGICKYRRGHVQVELGEAKFLGVTHFQPSRDARIGAAESVNADKFFEEYLSVFSNHHSSLTGQMS
jgi:hypothetical protein